MKVKLVGGPADGLEVEVKEMIPVISYVAPTSALVRPGICIQPLEKRWDYVPSEDEPATYVPMG